MKYLDDRFADIQLLRYRLEGFEQLSLLSVEGHALRT